jgi:hypothetical protein
VLFSKSNSSFESLRGVMKTVSITTYHHRQIGRFQLVLLLLLLLMVVTLGDVGPHPGWFGFIAFLLLVTGMLFGSLTAMISGDILYCRLGIGVFRRTFLLKEIIDAEIVRNRWYYGWGVRLTPEGWMFNVSGLDAVEIRLASGKRFRIGTDEPHQLVQAIRSQMIK